MGEPRRPGARGMWVGAGLMMLSLGVVAYAFVSTVDRITPTTRLTEAQPIEVSLRPDARVVIYRSEERFRRSDAPAPTCEIVRLNLTGDVGLFTSARSGGGIPGDAGRVFRPLLEYRPRGTGHYRLVCRGLGSDSIYVGQIPDAAESRVGTGLVGFAVLLGVGGCVYVYSRRQLRRWDSGDSPPTQVQPLPPKPVHR